MPRKLIYTSTAIIPSTQANSIQIMKMCSGLSRFGYDVTLLAGTMPSKKNIDIFDYYGIDRTFSVVRKMSGCHRGSTFLLSLRYFPMLERFAKSIMDIVFYGRDVLALYALARAGRHVTYEIHDTPKKGPRSWAENKLINSEHLYKIVFISNELKKLYIEKYGRLMARKRLIIAPDGADEPPNFSEKAVLNGSFSFNACYIGNFHRGRGTELILDIAGRMPDVGFHLFGGTEKQVLQPKQKSLLNVYFYGYVKPSETYKLRNAANVLLMPYQKQVMIAQHSSETSRWMSPIKLFEYMSAKKPIISSNHIVLREVLEDSRNCLLCEPDNIEQWVAAIAKLMADKELSRDISDTAYDDFVTNYTWDKRIQRIFTDDKIVVNG